jgi:hypothetical protein
MPGVWDMISCSFVGQIIWCDNAVLTATKALYFIRKYFISNAHFYTKSKRQCSIVVVICYCTTTTTTTTILLGSSSSSSSSSSSDSSNNNNNNNYYYYYSCVCLIMHGKRLVVVLGNGGGSPLISALARGVITFTPRPL